MSQSNTYCSSSVSVSCMNKHCQMNLLGTVTQWLTHKVWICSLSSNLVCEKQYFSSTDCCFWAGCTVCPELNYYTHAYFQECTFLKVRNYILQQMQYMHTDTFRDKTMEDAYSQNKIHGSLSVGQYPEKSYIYPFKG